MGFDGRIQSIDDEMSGQGDSDLADETGHNVGYWRSVVDLYLSHLWPPPGTKADSRLNVVRDYAFAEAILEWAAEDWKDKALDRHAHVHKGTAFGDSPGKGASIGPFQGYADESWLALRDNPELRSEVRQLDRDFTVRYRVSYEDHPASVPKDKGTRSPGPHGRVAPTADEDARLQDVLSEFDILRNPHISLLGKVKLSVDYAQKIMEHKSGSVSNIIWRLPDRTLRYVLMAFEISGDDDDWPIKVAATITEADKKNDPEFSLDLAFHDMRIQRTYEAVKIRDWSLRCKYKELVKPTP